MDTVQEQSSSDRYDAKVQNHVKLVDNGPICAIKNSTELDVTTADGPKSTFVKEKSSGHTVPCVDELHSIKHLKANASLNMMLETYSVRKIEGQTRSGTNITGYEFTVETFQGSIQHLPASPFSIESSDPATSHSAPAREISRWNLVERWRAFKRSV